MVVGVRSFSGTTAASAAAIRWVSKDGIGTVGRLFIGLAIGSRQNQSDVFKVSAQLNEVATKKSSNSAAVPEAKSEESAKESPAQNSVPDVSSISAFMTQVAHVKLVDSRDIMELQLKATGL
ncbi:hypothetical protein ACSBR2_004637 [Camellia fascicularis]